MKKRFSVFTVVGVSLVTAVVVAAVVAWTGNVRHGGSVQVVNEGSANPAVQPASWFSAQPESFADLAEKVQSAVVNVSTSKKMAGRRMMPFPNMGPRDPFDDFFEKFFEGMPREQTQKSLGSGFIIDKDGTILTNNHVVSQADEIEVQLSNKKKYKAKIVGTDEKSDIAVIKIKADGDLPTVPLGSSKAMRPGDWVMAIGNPFGLEHTVTVGVVSAMGRSIGGGPYAKFIQTDASINPGNSGGPLFNIKGEVIGINTMIYAGGQGIGFAIPIDMARNMLPDLVSKGSVSRGWLGVSIQGVTPELAKSFNLQDESGALIAEVSQDSPAASAGLRRGDIVVEFDGKKVEEFSDLPLLVGEAKPNSKVTMKVLRDGKPTELTVVVGKNEGVSASASPEERESGVTGKPDQMGLTVRVVTAGDTRELDVPADFRGVVVTGVEPDSAAESANVQTGDVILEINSAKVGSLDEYKRAVASVKKGEIVRLLIKRGKASIYLAFKL